MKWFFIDESITDGERRQGPYSIDEIREFVKQGKITETTLVWHSGESDWCTWKDAENAIAEKTAEEFAAGNDARDPEQQKMLEDAIKALEQIATESKRNTLRFPGFFTRAFAFLVDNAILCTFGVITLLVSTKFFGLDFNAMQQAFNAYMESPTSTEAMNNLLAVPGVTTFLTVVTLFQTAYFVIFHAIYSATPGKRLAHIHVVTADGNNLTWGSSIARYLCSVLTQFSLALYGLGYLIVFVDPKRRALHDWIARTFVVYDEPKIEKEPGKKGADDTPQGN